MADHIDCPGCSARLIVTEHSGGTPGGKDREYGYCPKCDALVVNVVTSGLISVRLAEEEK